MEWIGATGAALQLALRVVEATRTLFYDALEELTELAKQLILSPSNPFEIADRVAGFAHTAADLTGAAGRLVMALLEAMHALRTLMAQLVPIIARGVDAIGEVVAQMLPGAGALVMTALGGPLMGGAGTLLGGAGENLLQRSAEVEELDPSSLEGKQRDAWDRAQTVTAISSLSDLVSVNGTTDLIGGADSTVIDIKKIIGPDGAERWVVALPSTQDWQFFSDAGALNDRDSNIALMLNDAAFRSVYERAVREAMRVAGIPQGADVILTGFSQGGILAAKLASDDTFPYNTVGVVTNGSSVDSFSVPPDIPVYAFQHRTDAVPMLDGNPYGPTQPNVRRILLEGPWSPLSAHDNAAYEESIREWEAQGTEGPTARPANIDTFTGQVVEHSLFRASE